MAYPHCLNSQLKGCARLMNLESNLIRLRFKSVESELSRLGNLGS